MNQQEDTISISTAEYELLRLLVAAVVALDNAVYQQRAEWDVIKSRIASACWIARQGRKFGREELYDKNL